MNRRKTLTWYCFINLLMILVLVGGHNMVAYAEEHNEVLPDFDQMWDFNHPDRTEKKFRELLTKAEESGEMSYYVQLLTQIARAEGLQQKFDAAHKTLDQAEKRITDNLAVAKIRYLLERGRVFNSSKHKDKARPLFLKAYQLGMKEKVDFHTIDAAHMMGIIEPPGKALEWNEKAMSAAEKSDDKRARGWLGSLYNNIGWTYFDMKNYEKALPLFDKCVAWHKENKNKIGLRIAKYSVAKTKRSMGKIQEALDIQKALEKEINAANDEKDGYVYEEIAECLYLLGKKEEAHRYFILAYEYLSKDQWLVSNEKERLKRLKKLAEESQ